MKIHRTDTQQWWSCVHMYTTSKRIELESPSWSGLIRFWIFYKHLAYFLTLYRTKTKNIFLKKFFYFLWFSKFGLNLFFSLFKKGTHMLCLFHHILWRNWARKSRLLMFRSSLDLLLILYNWDFLDQFVQKLW